ncbi:PepSY-associated TM helix domain-containing protein [Zestomonas carbonaria]|uniref:PepSY domain-containing protein n=1 Tax=Zestomonas carbonaria TaxID=2762745 RepID=A0A7U7EPW3_9GAMM|nr:PepSY-associated TM helix domain-containing protein [Pseudomonas carbonaria]CAD5108568.1 hypothetical protein PSEWESI4_02856 [Pseudomonas carbonaria]
MRADPSPKTGKQHRRLWFDIHSWAGLKFSLLMTFVCLTGTLAVFAHEIDWLLHEEIQVTPQARTASWGDMLEAIQTRYPDWTLDYLAAPEGPRFAAMATMVTGDGERRFVWVDPYLGQVTGDTGWLSAQRILRTSHRHLLLPTRIGVPLVSALSLLLLLSLISSLYIYKHWWRGFFTWPRGGRPRRLWGDVHRLAGVWSLWFVVLMAATGFWYLVESLGGDAAVPALARQAQSERPATPLDPASVDRAVTEARRLWPAFEVRGLYPSPDGSSLRLAGQAQAWLVRDRANVLVFDLRQGLLRGQFDARDMSLHQRIAEMADPLHFGTFMGLSSKLLWFLFGAALTALSVTGVYLYGLRSIEALRSRQRREQRR